MKFNERGKSQKPLAPVIQLRNRGGLESLVAMVDMIDAVHNLCISSIKLEKPGITDKDLVNQLTIMISITRYMDGNTGGSNEIE